MQQKIPAFVAAVLLACVLMYSRQTESPSISVRISPSDKPLHAATCNASYSGYLHNTKTGRPVISEDAIGKFIGEQLREGYVLTVYPPTSRGIWVNSDCPTTAP